MNAQIIRVIARAAAVAALAFGFILGSASLAGAQLPPELSPPELSPPEDDGGSDDGSPLPDELSPITDLLAPVLDPILEQFPGDDGGTGDGSTGDGGTGDGGTGDGGSSDGGSSDGGFASPSNESSTLPQTGGTVAIGLASALAAGALALRRVLRA